MIRRSGDDAPDAVTGAYDARFERLLIAMGGQQKFEVVDSHGQRGSRVEEYFSGLEGKKKMEMEGGLGAGIGRNVCERWGRAKG